MNPGDLIGPASALGAPAPYGFLVFFKVLGFTLHLIPMNLWAAGLLVALLARARGGEPARRWSGRLLAQMPLLISLGINFGVVPLLFTQVSHYRVFYPATILMAWPWLSVIGLLTVAYYGVYLHVAGLKSGRPRALHRAAGWVSAILFTAIGFLFVNAFSLMTNLADWPDLWRKTAVSGAVWGTALNTADPTLWPRWLMLLGLALTTTAAHVAVDAGLFAGGETPAYRSWAAGFAWKLHLFGLAWYAAAGGWYAFGTWAPAVRDLMFSGPAAGLTAATALSPGLVLLLLFLAARRGAVGRGTAWAVGAAQLAVLGLNAVSRQVVQNRELLRWLDVAAEPVRTQWGPLVLFLLLFAAGAAVVGWMVTKVVEAGRRPAG